MVRPDIDTVGRHGARDQERSRASLSPAVISGLVVAGMAATTNAQVFALLLSPIASDLGVSVAQLGGLRTIEEVVAITTGLALTPVIDRYARRHLLLAGFLLMAVAAVLASLSVHPSMLIGYFIIDGVSKIFLFASVLAFPSDIARGQALDRALGFIIGSFALTGFTTVPLAGVLASEFSWRAGFWLATTIAIGAFAMTLRILPIVTPVQHGTASIRDQIRTIAALPGLRAGLAGAMFRFAMYATVLNYTSAFFVDDYEVPVSRAGFYFSIGSLGFLGASVASGYLLARIGGGRALIGGGLLAGVFATSAYTAGFPLAVAGLSLFLTASMMGVLENASTALLFRLAPHHRGAAMSLNELGAACGSLLGIGLGALALREAGYQGIGIVLGVAGVLAAVTTGMALHAALARKTTH